MSKKIPYLAGFLLPFLLAVIVCIAHEVYPFGEQCILQVDMYHQYCPFFTELMQKLKNGESFFYSWNIGLGSDFVSLFAYYLASPFNILLLFCPQKHVVEFMTILVLVKIGLSGFSFTYYLIEHFGLAQKKDTRIGGEPAQIYAFAAAVFGCAYALSAYMAAYAWNIMWLDGMALAPLVILGLERMTKTGNPILYYTALALCIWSNYYIAIMICIFLVLWFLVCFFENRKSGISAWLRFAWFSLLAGGTAAVLIIPTAIVLGYSGHQGISFPESFTWYFNLSKELARQLMLVETYTGADHWPNLYCGVFVLVLFVLYLLNREISWKRKLPRVSLLALFVVSFACNVPDFIWHGLHFPTSLPARQAFLYIFLLLLVSFEGFLYLRQTRLWQVAAAAVINAGFLFAAYRVQSTEFEDTVFLVSAVFIACYLVLAAGYLLANARVRGLLLGISCFAVIAELTLNQDATGFDTVSRTAYMEYQENYASLLAQAYVLAQEQAADEAVFYRVEGLERKCKNDAALYGYHSGTQFSSLMNLNVSHFYQAVGMEGGKNFYCANGATPLLSAMLSIRYVLADNDMEEGPLRHMAASAENAWLYENAYVLPLGFMMREDVIAAWDYENTDDIASQNQLAQLLGAEAQMLSPVSSVSAEGETSFEVMEDGYYYASYEKTSVNNLTLTVSDGRTRSYSKVSHGYTLELGYCTAGSTVSLTNSDGVMIPMTVYLLNEEAVKTAYESLDAQTLALEEFSDTKIRGTIHVEDAGRLIFSIADEKGWTLFVDGTEVESEMFAGAFISVHLESGEHEIELSYQTPGISLGACISLLCAAAAVFFMWLYKVHRKKLCD